MTYRYRKIIATLLAVMYVISITALFSPEKAYAAIKIVDIQALRWSEGTAVFSWELPATRSVEITMHVPNPDGTATLTTLPPINTSGGLASLGGLEKDYIYDLYIEMYDAPGGRSGVGSRIGEGFLYYLPAMSFEAMPVEQERETMAGGGFESGTKPTVKIKWTTPRVYDHLNTNKYIPIQVWGDGMGNKAVLDMMKNKVNSYYSSRITGVELMNYRINISTDQQRLNNSPTNNSILINYDTATYGYTAATSELPADTCKLVQEGDAMSAYVLGRKDAVDRVPTVAQVRSDPARYLPVPVQPYKDYTLTDNGILPGTVYYMNIKPMFKMGNSNINLMTVGGMENQNGSPITGTKAYMHTPIRFQLSKDSANNVYVKVFRINQGSLDMPGMYYELQASDDPSVPGDWTPPKAKMTDKFFPSGSEYAVTVIPDVNPNNEIYYRVVVKTDTRDDRIESLKMPYVLQVDTSRPPVPIGLTSTDRTLTIDPADPTKKYTDVTIAWKKPSNWSQIKAGTDPNQDIVFHLLLNTYYTDLNAEKPLEAEGKKYGNFLVNYRRVLYFSAHSSQIDDSDPNTLKYTIRGSQLFTGEYMTGMSGGSAVTATETLASNGYPTFLLPNKAYYIKMYTTLGKDRNANLSEKDKVSEISVAASFTTLTNIEVDVPLVKSLRLNKNEVEAVQDNTGKKTYNNYIEIQFEKVNIDFSNYVPNPDALQKDIYYDLYMSNDTVADHFVRIATTQKPDGDVLFTGLDVDSPYIKALIKDFSAGSDADTPNAYAVFGEKLRPNTTYYFMVKTRLVIQGQPEKQSRGTTLLPVTTIVGEMQPPDNTHKKPLAPVDFGIATDDQGNLEISGSRVKFQWTRQESGVKYRIICTSRKVDPDAPLAAYTNDPIYQSYAAAFGPVLLDPAASPLPAKFAYNSETKTFSYIIDRWLFPNRVYYFSIQAENSEGAVSAWVSIPVTTLMIEAPSSLQVVQAGEIGFYWIDSDAQANADSYLLYIKGPGDTAYRPLNKAQSTIIKEGSTCYARIYNLKLDSKYDIRVHRNNTAQQIIFDKLAVPTRNPYHEIDVKWVGAPGYRYELAIKGMNDADYTVLNDYDLLTVSNAVGGSAPYSIEKSSKTQGTPNYDFYARIRTMPVKMPGGIILHQPLKTNTRYQVKVRAVKTDTLDTSLVAYSKYIGPVETRTEFNQDDYDKEEDKEDTKVKFLDRIKEIEQNYYWRMDMDNNKVNKLLLKGDRLANAMQNLAADRFVLDISAIASGMDTDAVYAPVQVFDAMTRYNKSLVIRTAGAEYTFRAGTLNTAEGYEFEELRKRQGVKDIFVRLETVRSEKAAPALPSNAAAASKVNTYKVQAAGMKSTYTQLRDLYLDKLYNDSSGLVKEKLDIIAYIFDTQNQPGSAVMEDYINTMIKDVEKKLSLYIGDTIEGGGGISPSILETRSIQEFRLPLTVTLQLNAGVSGRTVPYVWTESTGSWRQLELSNGDMFAAASFDTVYPGRYVLAVFAQGFKDVPAGYWAESAIRRITGKYNLQDVFGSSEYLYPDEKATVKEAVLLYEKVLGKDVENAGLDIRQKAKTLGLDRVISLTNPTSRLQRQEAAQIVVTLYGSKIGIPAGMLQPETSQLVSDEDSIQDRYYAGVMVSLELGMFSLDAQQRFQPEQGATRAQMINAVVCALELAGDLN